MVVLYEPISGLGCKVKDSITEGQLWRGCGCGKFLDFIYGQILSLPQYGTPEHSSPLIEPSCHMVWPLANPQKATSHSYATHIIRCLRSATFCGAWTEDDLLQHLSLWPFPSAQAWSEAFPKLNHLPLNLVIIMYIIRVGESGSKCTGWRGAPSLLGVYFVLGSEISETASCSNRLHP